MEIKIGEYVRTKNGIIDEIVNIEYAGSGIRYCGERLENTIIILKGDILSEFRINRNDIVKHSKNIVDLIEVGDYVNGYRIDNIIEGVLVNRANGIDRSGVLTPVAQYNNDIKTILTKEQYTQNCYKVEGK